MDLWSYVCKTITCTHTEGHWEISNCIDSNTSKKYAKYFIHKNTPRQYTAVKMLIFG